MHENVEPQLTTVFFHSSQFWLRIVELEKNIFRFRSTFSYKCL